MSNNTIILKRSSVTGKKPTESQLQYGELSINYADGELYYKSSDNGSFFARSVKAGSG